MANKMQRWLYGWGALFLASPAFAYDQIDCYAWFNQAKFTASARSSAFKIEKDGGITLVALGSKTSDSDLVQKLKIEGSKSRVEIHRDPKTKQITKITTFQIDSSSPTSQLESETVFKKDGDRNGCVATFARAIGNARAASTTLFDARACMRWGRRTKPSAKDTCPEKSERKIIADLTFGPETAKDGNPKNPGPFAAMLEPEYLSWCCGIGSDYAYDLAEKMIKNFQVRDRPAYKFVSNWMRDSSCDQKYAPEIVALFTYLRASFDTFCEGTEAFRIPSETLETGRQPLPARDNISGTDAL